MANKKTKARRARAAAADRDHDRKQQRLEARRRAKAEALAARRRSERRRKIVRAVVLAVAAAGAAWAFWELTQPAETPDSIAGHPVRKLGESGEAVHVTGTVDYDSSPPVHGPHAAQPAPCGVHSEPVPNENQVHSLEHGAVGIQYQPDLAPEDIARIEGIVRRFESGVFSAPYPDMESPITLTSWGELMTLDALDVDALNRYIEVFRGAGPEDATCPNDVDAPFRAPGADGDRASRS